MARISLGALRGRVERLRVPCSVSHDRMEHYLDEHDAPAPSAGEGAEHCVCGARIRTIRLIHELSAEATECAV